MPLSIPQNQGSKREVIIQTAANLFKEKGYPATTMRDLAEKVGMEAASLYNHINSKEQILVDLCMEVGNKFIEKTREVEKLSGSAKEKLRALIAGHIEITTTYTSMVAVANDDWRHLPDPELSQFLEMRKTYENEFLQYIQQGMDSLELQVQNPTIVLYSVLSSVRWLQYWYRPEREETIEEIQTQIIDLLMKGLIN